MASKIKVDQIEGSTASTITLPSGQTLDLSSGSITLPDSAVDLSTAKVTGTLGSSNLPTIPVSKGGTGLTSLGTAGQALKVNSGANGLEFGDASSDFVKLASGTMSSASTSFDVNGYFTSDYNHYELVIDNLRNNNSANSTYLRVLVNGTENTASSYRYGWRYVGVQNNSAGNHGDGDGWNQDKIQVTNDISSGGDFKSIQHYRIYNPLDTDQYKIITWINHGTYQNGGGVLTQFGGATWANTAAISGVKLFPQASDFNELKFNLYGIKGA